MSINTAAQTQTKTSGTKVALVSTFNVACVILMIGILYSVCEDPAFVVNDNIIPLVITGSVIFVLSVISLMGIGNAITGAFTKDREKKEIAFKMAYNLALTSLLTIITIGFIGMLVACCITTPNSRGVGGSSAFESFLIINAIGSCIGPCFSAIGDILGSINF